ncbi:hypothetical protein KUCAC02_017136 [Chaenocephalus aceratus]|uniref:Uncharacterized protein n=1 Tax=Chaenocephalus aceratus TaxID=36190 RepID=A0ACB9W1E6_CHAAC|nr:hypothetical protein KUCAC02_017136 [Chaenocephalus aceratus]
MNSLCVRRGPGQSSRVQEDRAVPSRAIPGPSFSWPETCDKRNPEARQTAPAGDQRKASPVQKKRREVGGASRPRPPVPDVLLSPCPIMLDNCTAHQPLSVLQVPGLRGTVPHQSWVHRVAAGGSGGSGLRVYVHVYTTGQMEEDKWLQAAGCAEAFASEPWSLTRRGVRELSWSRRLESDRKAPVSLEIRLKL